MDKNESLIPLHGGYLKLKSFPVAQLVYDVTARFCERYIERGSRTRDPMAQAARSGVQNIAEGSHASGTSKKTELKLAMMRAALCVLMLAIFPGAARGARDLKVSFLLQTTDTSGAPKTEHRYYYLYRPDNLSRATAVPMVLVMEAGAGSAPATFFRRKADQAGFLVVSCAIVGNSLGTVWNNKDPRVTGSEDYDYVAAVINRVGRSDNARDAFICGLSKGGHMSYAYACERPKTIRAACSIDEFMGLTSNRPTAPVPIMAMHGTLDQNVPYTMAKDSVDAWRAVDGLLDAAPVTTYEAAPLQPGRVTQATWRGTNNDLQVAFVTIIGGTHCYALPRVQTGYDCTEGMWAFFSQFLTGTQDSPRIVSQPVNNYQPSGLPASFWVSATGKAPLSYQWQQNGTNIQGATANWLTLPATGLADDGAAFCAVVRNSSGCVTSAVATLHVTAAPANPGISAQPANQTVQAGQPVQFTVSATGSAPLAFQWRKNGMEISGATTSSLNLPAAIVPDGGAGFDVVVSNSSGSITSAAATLTVKPAPGAPVIIANPARVRVLTGQTGTFSVTASSATPMSYQWQRGTFTGNMVGIPGATNAMYTTAPGRLKDHHSLFRCVVSNGAGNATSAGEMLFVTTAPR